MSSLVYRQSIVVRKFAPTNFRGARYKATCARGSITLPEDFRLNPMENVEAALKALLSKFISEDMKASPDSGASNPWRGPWQGGQLPNGDYVFTSNAGFKGNYIRIDSIGGKYL